MKSILFTSRILYVVRSTNRQYSAVVRNVAAFNTTKIPCHPSQTSSTGHLHQPCTRPVLAVQSRSSHTSLDDVDLSKYALKDPVKGDLVYVGTLSSLVKGVKIFSLSTSAMGLSMQPLILKNIAKLPIALKLATVMSTSFLVLGTPLLLHWITGRYVTHMYYNRESGSFTASTYTLFCTRRDHVFTASEAISPDIPGLLTTVTVKNKALFFEPSLFLDQQAYIKLMGYDKPIDWNMPDDIKRMDDEREK